MSYVSQKIDFVYGECGYEDRKKNFYNLKSAIESHKKLFLDGIIEIHADDTINIVGENTIEGGNIICYPFIPEEGVRSKLFALSDNSSIDINKCILERKNTKKYDTYFCQCEGNKIKKDVFRRELSIGETVYFAWAVAVKGIKTKVVNIDEAYIYVAATIPHDNVTVGLYFDKDTPKDEYNQYGRPWHIDEGIDCIYNFSQNTRISLRETTIKNFEYNVSISSSDCNVKIDNVVLEGAQMGLAFYSRDIANYQSITVKNKLIVRNNGYVIAGGIASGTAYNLLGSGVYTHPNIIMDVDELILENNNAAAFRQYSGSGTKPVQPDYVSRFNKIIARGNKEAFWKDKN